ncbi:MAG: hypothetical protein KF751_21815 [Nitrospira sp.]|nr:hypothetical protein [Nitrospira sp.]
MPETVVYLHVHPGGAFPEVFPQAPFRAVVIAEAEVDPEWQSVLSKWLVRSGCLYMVAWGKSGSSWDDAVDNANLEEFEFGEIPEGKFVMTTWHDESLSEAFGFAKNSAFHATVDLRSTMLVHISACNREEELLLEYANA